jgi:hypothetical protein
VAHPIRKHVSWRGFDSKTVTIRAYVCHKVEYQIKKPEEGFYETIL